MTPFYVLGGVLAVWALLVAFLGITRHDFPGKNGERAVIVVSIVLVAGAIGSALVGAASQEEEEGGEGHAPEALALPGGLA